VVVFQEAGGDDIMKMRTVLYVERNIDGTIGGSYRSLLYLVRLLPKDQWRPVVAFYRDHHLMDDYRKAGCKVLLLEYPKSINLVAHAGVLGRWAPLRALILMLQKALNLLRGSVWLWLSHVRLLLRERVDVVHLNNGVMSGTELLCAARVLGIRTIVHQRGIQPLPGTFRFVRHLIDHVISVSDAAGAHLVANGLPPVRCTTVHNGINPAEFRASVGRDATAVKASLGLSPDAIVIGNSGMIKIWKGQLSLIDAIARLRDRHPDVHCVIVGGTSDSYDGDNKYLERIRAFMKEHGIENRVHFAGYQANVADYLQIFDIMVHTSVEPEPFSRSILEGMTMGRAIIASRNGGTPEAIEHGVTGLLYEPGNAAELAEALDGLLRQPDERLALGHGAQRRIDERFSIRTNVEATQRIYGRVLNFEHAAVAAQTA
jgi:glycosyltransferase involved in cell wall biosynthesis